MNSRPASFLIGSLVLGLAAVPAQTRAVTTITDWGTTITTSAETYQLVGDLTDDGSSPWAITVAPGVRNIIIRGMGFGLVGDGGAGSFEGGIRIDGTTSGVADLWIEGFAMRALDAGIAAEGSICHMTVRGCDISGLTSGRAISIRTVVPADLIRWVTVRDSRIRAGECQGIVFENAGNAGGAGARMEGLSVLSNAISDLNAPASGPEALRAAVLVIGGAERVRVRDNVILGGSDMSGVLFSSHDEAGESFRGIAVVGNVIGDRSGLDGTASAVAGIKLDRVRALDPAGMSFQENLLFSSEGPGVDNLPGSVPYTFDARRCWWGDDLGPAGPWGDGVSTGVGFLPVLELPRGVSLEPNLRLLGCGGFHPLVGVYNQDQAVPGIRGFDVDMKIRSVEADLVDYEKGGFLAQAGLPTQYYLTGAGDDRGLTAAILGGSAPLAVGNGDLFRLIFSGGTENAPVGYDGELLQPSLRDPDNGVIPVAGTRNARITVDCTPPEVTLTGIDDCGIPVVTVHAYDHDLDLVYIRIAPGCFSLLGTDLCGGGFDATVRMSEFADLPDGTYDIQACVTDDAGNESIATWTFVRDTVAPPPVAGLVVTGSHNEISLGWTPSALPVTIVRREWSYPEYDDDAPFPGYPTDPEDGDLVATVSPGTGSYVDSFDDTERNAYFYTLFNIDDCSRASNPEPGAQGKALSYWIGDFAASIPSFGPPYDGYVTPVDLVLLSGGFGTSEGDPGYDPQLDIGPTDTGFVDGIPLTDNQIDFEDVILFAIQYGTVAPAPPDAPLANPAGSGGAPRIEIALATGRAPDLLDLEIRLEGNHEEVKGLSVLLAIDPSQIRVLGGEIDGGLQGLPDPVFFAFAARGGNRHEIVVAPLGKDRVFLGSGPVARVHLRRMGRFGPDAVRLIASDLRDPENEPFGYVRPVSGPAAPGEIAAALPILFDAIPNPMRTSTRIRFLLDRPGPCELAVFDAAGRLVKRVFAGDAVAGLHGIDWDGRAENGEWAPSGIYHFILRAGGDRTARRVAVLR